jgi:hypothetical protein
MDTWEHSFREKSHRRSRRRTRRTMMKATILLLMFGGIAGATYLWVAGVPR